jgi:hypothetical protein
MHEWHIQFNDAGVSMVVGHNLARAGIYNSSIEAHRSMGRRTLQSHARMAYTIPAKHSMGRRIQSHARMAYTDSALNALNGP